MLWKVPLVQGRKEENADIDVGDEQEKIMICKGIADHGSKGLGKATGCS